MFDQKKELLHPKESNQIMYEIFDDYCWTKEKKVITKDVHRIQGLGNFAYWNLTNSTAPSPMHYHSNIIEIHCMIKGKRYTQFEKDHMITRYTYTGNQMFIAFPFEWHSNGSEPQTPCEFFAFQIDISNPYDLLGLNKEYSYALYQQLIRLKNHLLEVGKTHINYLKTAFTFFSAKTTEDFRIGVQFLTCFLFNLQFLTPVIQNQTLQIDQNIQDAIHYLTDNIRQNISLAELAKVSGYSLSYFKMKFKAETGITPLEYINMQKSK